MSLPVPEYPSRKLFANEVAVEERLLNQISMPSSLIENDTSGGAPEWLAAQAAFSASMIVPSLMRVSAAGLCGDWPCLAERMITVSFCRCRCLSADVIAPTCALM